MKSTNPSPHKVPFDRLYELFTERAKVLDLFTPGFCVTPKDAFDIYLNGWSKKLIRNNEIDRKTFYRWKARGWVDEDYADDFMTYCYGIRWTKIKPNSVLGQ